MTKPIPLIAIALFGFGGILTANAEPAKAPPLEKPALPQIATPEQEAEIRALIEDFVITEQEERTRAEEALREKKAREDAEKANDEDFDPFALDTPPDVLKEIQSYHKTRHDAFDRLKEFKEVAFPILVSHHLDDDRPTIFYLGKRFARTIGSACYMIIDMQLAKPPSNYMSPGFRRLGRDGNYHDVPYYSGRPYSESGGLESWLRENQHLSHAEMRIKCLSWLLNKEKEIGAPDPESYYWNILPLELEILELKAEIGNDVADELARLRELAEARPGDQVPKDLLPDSPLPYFEEKHALQERSATLETCPDGHATLKDIPIIYGDYRVLTKPPEEWDDDDKALAKRRDAGEILLGAKRWSGLDPRFRATCLTCKYQIEVRQVPDSVANWIKRGSRFDDFAHSFSDAARSLPFAGMEGVEITVAAGKKGRVFSESIELTTPANRKDELVEKLEKWVAENGFKRSLLRIENAEYQPMDEQFVEDWFASFYVLVSTDPDKGTTLFRFHLGRREYSMRESLNDPFAPPGP